MFDITILGSWFVRFSTYCFQATLKLTFSSLNKSCNSILASPYKITNVETVLGQI